MSSNLPETNIVSAEILQNCLELDPVLSFYTEELGFKVDTIFPADKPNFAVISGHGIRIRLQIGELPVQPTTLFLNCQNDTDGEFCEAPNGTMIMFCDAVPKLQMPAIKQSFVITKFDDDSNWGVGRAGMRYRDLIPGRQNGRVIASHIQIQTPGKVPDYAHYHNVRFQLIYCYKGWVRLVYEDQGEEFILKAGDCVLQPPLIRHRVLESGGGLEVIELGCPAEHQTYADHSITLPTGITNSRRNFSDQIFIRHQVDFAEWITWRISGFEARDTGIGDATKGLLSVKVVKPTESYTIPVIKHQNEFLFIFILTGQMHLVTKTENSHQLEQGDSVVIPSQQAHQITECSSDLEFLEVRLDADFPTTESLEF